MESRQFRIGGIQSQIRTAAQLMSRPGCVPVVLVVDASGSMTKRAQAVIESVRLAKETFNAMDDGRQYFLCIIQFNAEGHVSVGFTHSLTLPELFYSPGGGTLLYSTVYEALAMLMAALDEVENPRDDLQVTLAVFSDGDDTMSPAADLPKLQGLARRAQTSAVNFQLQTFGIGIDAPHLAGVMGFPLEFATTVEASARGVTEAMETMTSHTTLPPGYAADPAASNEVFNPPPAPPLPPPMPPGVDNTMGTNKFPDDDDSSGTFDPLNTLI